MPIKALKECHILFWILITGLARADTDLPLNLAWTRIHAEPQVSMGAAMGPQQTGLVVLGPVTPSWVYAGTGSGIGLPQQIQTSQGTLTVITSHATGKTMAVIGGSRSRAR